MAFRDLVTGSDRHRARVGQPFKACNGPSDRSESLFRKCPRGPGQTSSDARLTQTARTSLSNGGTLEIANVAARIKGSGKAGLKAVLLMAHYDSVPNAPGASDDGSGTATLLETLRALKAGPPPKRDIIALFTDGEEVGFIGARVFVGWWTILTVGSAWLLPGGSFVTLWPLVFRLATTALAWRVPWPPGAILLIDLGTLPAITIIGAGAYAFFATLDHRGCGGRGPVRSRGGPPATFPPVRSEKNIDPDDVTWKGRR
jgi:hypothetical protein